MTNEQKLDYLIDAAKALRSGKMKPFDLEAALAGAPVVTRDGIPVTDLHCFDGADEAYKVCALVEGRVVPVHADGRYLSCGESSFDLFMAPVKRGGWVNIYQWCGKPYCDFVVHATEEEARASGWTSGNTATTAVRLEWEE